MSFLTFRVALASSALFLAGGVLQGQLPKQLSLLSEEQLQGQSQRNKIIRSDALTPAGAVSDERDSGAVAVEIDSGAVAAEIEAVQSPVTVDQVPNKLAAFQITGAGLADFNGIYLPSDMENSQKACTSLTWQMGSGENLHLLYNLNGAWILDHRGQAPSYNAPDDGSCTPETAAWAAVGSEAGSAPTSLLRKTAATYTEAALRTEVSNSTPTAGAEPIYFVVTGAGIPGFNGVYYMTPLEVVDQRCERTWAKDGPRNTEYTLNYNNMWYFESIIGGQSNRAYVAQDDGSCSPDTAFSGPPSAGGRGVASKASDGAVPVVVRSLTATTSTTTTTTVDMAVADAAAAAAASNLTKAQPDPVASAPTRRRRRRRTKSAGLPVASPWWLRFFLPLSLGLAFEGQLSLLA